jgi:hypothetical protein
VKKGEAAVLEDEAAVLGRGAYLLLLPGCLFVLFLAYGFLSPSFRTAR